MLSVVGWKCGIWVCFFVGFKVCRHLNTTTPRKVPWHHRETHLAHLAHPAHPAHSAHFHFGVIILWSGNPNHTIYTLCTPRVFQRWVCWVGVGVFLKIYDTIADGVATPHFQIVDPHIHICLVKIINTLYTPPFWLVSIHKKNSPM